MTSLSKKVVIALAPLGGGHQSITQALTEAIHDDSPHTSVSTLNVFSAECSAFPLSAIPSLYPVFTANYPFLWRGLFYGTNGRVRFQLAERLVQPLVHARLKHHLQALKPDVVVSVFPALGYTLHRAIQELGWTIPLGVVVSDLVTIHPAWLYRQASWFAVPTEDAYAACLSAGIESSRIHRLGMPLRRSFYETPPDRATLRRVLGLDVDMPVVLLAGSGGNAQYVEAIIDELLDLDPPCQVLLITGGNQALRKRLERRRKAPSLRDLGSVTNMADWMRAADVLVTKAGPSTIMEAVQCELPMVIGWALPGQEEANLNYVADNGIGLVGRDPHALRVAVQRLLASHTQVRNLKQAMQLVQQPSAARRIADLILRDA